MAKSILVLDKTYENCFDCPLRFYSDVLGVQCAAEHRTICEMWEDIDQKGIPDWCPLKELPSHFPPFPKGNNVGDHDIGFIEGWNACLKEITEE